MVAPIPTLESRQALAVNLQFTRGRHGAAARIELHDRPTGRVAAVALCGWVDLSAGTRIEQAIDDLVARGATQLLVDCSCLRHIDYRMVRRLVNALDRFESRAGAVAVCGLSRYLRDLFRLSGRDVPFQPWPTAAEVMGRAAANGHSSEPAP
jgi:anti-anti-sigma factor